MDIILKEITKSFGQNRVLRGVNLHIRPGEIHALMGENGAGKSTMMNILTGLLKADSGTIIVDGQEVVYKNNLEAEQHGITFIHQELNIWQNLTVLENLFMLKQPKNRFGLIDFKKMKEIALAKCKEVGIDLPLDAIAGTCSVGQQQMVEIIRALMSNAQVVIMDEPTKGVDVGAKAEIYQIMGNLAKQGYGIVLISSEMPEILGMSARIVIMCNGKVTGELNKDEATQEGILELAMEKSK